MTPVLRPPIPTAPGSTLEWGELHGGGLALSLAEAARTHAAPVLVIVATSRAAEFLGTMDRGSLVPGKRADFLVLDANPLDDIRNTRRIAKMYLSGVEVDRAALRESLTRNAGSR